LPFKKLNGINYILVHTFVVEMWNNKSPQEITFTKKTLNKGLLKE
jgi:hypothetical protein